MYFKQAPLVYKYCKYMFLTMSFQLKYVWETGQGFLGPGSSEDVQSPGGRGGTSLGPRVF